MKRDIDLSRSEIEHLIDEWIFDKRNREIIKRRLLDHECFDDLASQYHLTVRQIKYIVYKGEDKIFKHI